MPSLSIITTVFNAEKYLEDSLQSLLDQTFTDFEIILVNDGCTDGSTEILKDFASKHNAIYLENEKNEGVPFGRNKALQQAQGEYIAIHDADDISLSFRLEKEVSYLQSHQNIDFMGGHAIKIGENGEIIGSMSYPPPDTTGGIKAIHHWKLNPIIDPSCMFRRSIILEHGAYSLDPRYLTVQDFELWCRLLANGCLMANLQEPLIKYRINPNGVTAGKYQEQRLATDMVWGKFCKRRMQKLEQGKSAKK